MFAFSLAMKFNQSIWSIAWKVHTKKNGASLPWKAAYFLLGRDPEAMVGYNIPGSYPNIPSVTQFTRTDRLGQESLTERGSCWSEYRAIPLGSLSWLVGVSERVKNRAQHVGF